MNYEYEPYFVSLLSCFCILEADYSNYFKFCLLLLKLTFGCLWFFDFKLHRTHLNVVKDVSLYYLFGT